MITNWTCSMTKQSEGQCKEQKSFYVALPVSCRTSDWQLMYVVSDQIAISSIRELLMKSGSIVELKQKQSFCKRMNLAIYRCLLKGREYWILSLSLCLAYWHSSVKPSVVQVAENNVDELPSSVFHKRPTHDCILPLASIGTVKRVEMRLLHLDSERDIQQSTTCWM